MVSSELVALWNEQDGEGVIQPPLSEAEVDALSRREIYPQTMIEYGQYRAMARTALIACPYIRLPENPELTAEALAAFK